LGSAVPQQIQPYVDVKEVKGPDIYMYMYYENRTQGTQRKIAKKYNVQKQIMKSKNIYIPSLTKQPEQQPFAMRSGVLTSIYGIKM